MPVCSPNSKPQREPGAGVLRTLPIPRNSSGWSRLLVVDLLRQFHERPDYARVDKSYYDNALKAICADTEMLEKSIQEFADRPLAQLDPVERGILLLGFYELMEQHDVPYKVVINESVNLTKRFGAIDGHKYINAVLDRAAAKLRPAS